MKCSRCNVQTPTLVNDGLCWTCAFPRQPDFAAHQHVAADEHAACVAKTASPSR